MQYSAWPSVMQVLAEHLNEITMQRWFQNILDVEKQQNRLYIKVKSQLQADWMEAHYSQMIQEAVWNKTQEELEICFITEQMDRQPAGSFQTNEVDYDALTSEPIRRNNRFNPRYTFETFVVGAGNRFAHAAALAVADRPAQSYNPLFLYGGSGLGKTHLMHAIGHRVSYLRPETNIVYISTETFTNEFIAAVRQGMAHKFKNLYRNADIFLVDDIQFLTGKEGTQEEFFHTFNALYEQGKQIVISSDRHPKDIATLEERLRSRFEGGLITDIQPPDLETRIAILQYKADMENVTIMDDAIYYIANNIPSNIRELEGALNRVKYFAAVNHNQIISLELTQDVLQGILPNQKKQALSSDFIKQTVADYFHIKPTDLASPRRDQSITKPRHIAMYLCQTLLNQSLSDIGREFGGRDHTTVLHGCKKIQKDIKTDHNLDQNLKDIMERIQQN